MRNPTPFALTACAVILGTACSKNETPTPAATTTPPATTSAPVDTPKAPAPDDLDVAQLQATLKCPGTSFKAACEILDEFKKAAAWDLTMIRGADARYFGRGVEASGGEVAERYYFLIAKRVPLNEVSASDLPLKLSFRQLETSREVEIAQAPKLLRLLEKDDAVNKTIQTAKYVLEYSVSAWDGASASKGPSTFAQIGGGAYIRMVSNRRLVLVQPAPTRPGAQPGEGVYALLYPLSW